MGEPDVVSAGPTSATARGVDGSAIVSFVFAVAAAATSGLWFLSTAFAAAALTGSLVSRRALRNEPLLRGTALSVGAFLISAGVLTLVLGPILLSIVLFSFSAH